MPRENPKLDHTPELLGLITHVLLLVALVWLLLASPGCKKSSNTKVVAPGDDTSSADRRERTNDDDDRDDGTIATVTAGDGESAPAFAAIYFELDESTLGDDARQELQELAGWLNAHPKAHITIEGHCDERGTDEYNVALGQKRAHVIRDYLERLGVARARLATISYGEERPAATGESEDAWAQNRRGELVPDR